MNDRQHKNADFSYIEKYKDDLYQGGLIIGVSSIFLLSRYKRCKPDEYLIRNGFGIKNNKVSKSGGFV